MVLCLVILDANGFSKGYGFVRFADEDEQKDALNHMNGFKVSCHLKAGAKKSLCGVL